MSAREKDEHEKLAEELLPCLPGCSWNATFTEFLHDYHCQYKRRPAVAAAFRARAEKHKAEVERLEQRIRILENPRVTDEDFRKVAELQFAELTDLRAQLATAKIAGMEKLIAFAEKYPCNCAKYYPGSEYHGYDCQNKVAKEFVAQFDVLIDAEKAGK